MGQKLGMFYPYYHTVPCTVKPSVGLDTLVNTRIETDTKQKIVFELWKYWNAFINTYFAGTLIPRIREIR